jgi:metal-responsive CopG/Arc/MetJ family transcriptional regulator
MEKHKDEPIVERIVVPVTAELSEAIKDFWHERRLNSKSEAVRHLIRVGLDAEKKAHSRKK